MLEFARRNLGILELEKSAKSPLIIVNSLPDPNSSDVDRTKVYAIKTTDDEGNNKYTEYIVVGNEIDGFEFEEVGAPGKADVSEMNQKLLALADVVNEHIVNADTKYTTKAETTEVKDDVAVNTTAILTLNNNLALAVTTLSNGILTNSTAISEEVNRATAAESGLGTRITEEATARAQQDAQLAADIVAETSRAKSVEEANATNIQANTQAIADEVSRATGVEAGLLTAVDANAAAIVSESARAKTKEAEIDEDIVEINTAIEGIRGTITTDEERLSAVESGLSTTNDNLTAEIARAKAAEETNAQAIATETQRAQAAELAEKTRAEAAELAEKTRAEAAEATEKSRAELAELAEKNRAEAAEAQLTADLAAEATTRSTNDTTLQNNIDAEVAARKAAIEALDAEYTLTSEDTHVTITLKQEDGKVIAFSLSTNDIASAAAFKQFIDVTLPAYKNEVNGKFNDEANSRAAQDTLLQTSINTLQSNLISKTEAIDAEHTQLRARMSNIEGVNTTNTTAITTINGDDAGKSMRQVASEELAAQLIPDTAKDALNTIQEIAAWIQSHPEDAAALNTAITKEVNDRIAAINTVNQSLTEEVTRAKNKETELNTKIENNTTAIATEKVRAEAAEAALDTKIETAKTNIQTANTAILTETSRAKVKETEIADSVTLEALTRSSEITRVEHLVSDEVTRAKAAELANTNAISAVETSVEELQGFADNVSTLVNNEKEARINADSHLQLLITTMGDTLTSTSDSATAALNEVTIMKNTTLPNAVTECKEYTDAEQERAETAEETLTTNLAAEVTRATGAETTLTTNLSNEVTRAQGAESTLTQNLTAETTRATNAENTLTTNLASEVTRATEAEGTLTTNLSNEVTRAKAAEEAEETRAKAAEKANSDAIEAETLRAQTAEQTNATAISNEETRAKNAELANSNGIDAINTKIGKHSTETEAATGLIAELEALNKDTLHLMPGDTNTGGNPYNLSYYFYTVPSADKIVAHAKTISLDGNKTQGDYSLDIDVATASIAGLLSASDKQKIDAMWTMLDTDENAEAIDRWEEIKSFLASINPKNKTLVGLLEGKVDKVEGSSLVEDTKIAAYDAHLINTSNPHGVTATQVGLGNVDNTSDADKPVSTAQQAALDGKLDLMPGDAYTGGNAYNLPYYFEVEYQGDKVIVKSHSVTLDGKKTHLIYPLDINTATTTLAGLMSAADKVKLESALQEHQDISGKVDKVEGSSLVANTKVTAYDTHIADTDIHVTTDNKTAWNAKYDKPSTGIPSTDLTEAVQTSLGKADSAVQPEEGKGLFSGSYNDLKDTPTIPTKTTVTTGTNNGTVSVDGTDVDVKGLGSAAYNDATAFDVAGAAATVQGETTSTVKDAMDAIGSEAIPAEYYANYSEYTADYEAHSLGINLAKDVFNDLPANDEEKVKIGTGINATGLYKYVNDTVATKLDTITDLATIRQGAEKGATAVQPVKGKDLFSGSYNDLTDKPTIPSITELEKASNKTTSISDKSTDDLYPSAKAVYDYIQSLNANNTSY